MLRYLFLAVVLLCPLAEAQEKQILKIFADKISEDGTLQNVKVATADGYVMTKGKAKLEGIDSRAKLTFEKATFRNVAGKNDTAGTNAGLTLTSSAGDTVVLVLGDSLSIEFEFLGYSDKVSKVKILQFKGEAATASDYENLNYVDLLKFAQSGDTKLLEQGNQR